MFTIKGLILQSNIFIKQNLSLCTKTRHDNRVTYQADELLRQFSAWKSPLALVWVLKGNTVCQFILGHSSCERLYRMWPIMTDNVTSGKGRRILIQL